MSSPLDSSVTLGAALELVESRRIPIAPEVAGYLCLELAERASMQPGGLVPEGVFLGEEGSVAFVPRAAADAPEQFVRSLLKRLLEASASRPAALWQVTASTRPGLEGLVRELEAALIPLNRMASRRSLARLAREVKRVTHGVGRNAPSSVRATPPRASNPPAKLPPPSAPPLASVPAPAPSAAPPAAAPPEAPASPAPASPAPASSLSTPPAVDRMPVPTPPPVARASSAPPPPRLSAIDELLNALDPAPAPETPVTDAATRRQLKEMAGLDPTPPPPNAVVYDDDSRDDDDDSRDDLDDDDGAEAPTAEESEAIEALLVASASGPQGRLAEAMRPSRPHLPAVAPVPPVGDRPRTDSTLPELPSAPLPPVAARTIDVDPPGLATSARGRESTPRDLRRSTPPGVRSRARSGGGGRTIAVTLLFVFGLGLGLVYFLRPQWMLGHELATPAPSGSAAPERASARACAIRVMGAPEGAEILLLQGHAPLDVSPMPAGARIEFVGLLAGHAPKRAVVPAQGKWDQDERGRPRYELALELAPSRKKSDPWPPAEPGTTVGGEGEPGTVRVVSSPRDAEVWLLFGSGPDAMLDPVPCRAHEVLVASGTTVRTRLPIAAEDFAPAADGGVSWVTIDAKRPTTGGR